MRLCTRRKPGVTRALVNASRSFHSDWTDERDQAPEADLIGHYRLARHSGGFGLFAEVHVDVADHATRLVEVAPTAFDWLKEDYGPGAWEWSVCDEFRASAVWAAGFALEHLATARSGMRARVELIRAAPADTTPDCIAFAACHAVWNALQDLGAARVTLEGRQILFDGVPFAQNEK